MAIVASNRVVALHESQLVARITIAHALNALDELLLCTGSVWDAGAVAESLV